MTDSDRSPRVRGARARVSASGGSRPRRRRRPSGPDATRGAGPGGWASVATGAARPLPPATRDVVAPPRCAGPGRCRTAATAAAATGRRPDGPTWWDSGRTMPPSKERSPGASCCSSGWAEADPGGGRLDAGLAGQVAHVAHLVVGHQRDDGALGAGAGGAARAVQVGLVLDRRVGVDDERDVVDVDAAGGDVGGDQRAWPCRSGTRPCCGCGRSG